MEITANVKSIAQLKDYFFIVPDYQREYVWKPDDQIEQFLVDIENEFDPNKTSNYFIGSIIIVENNNKYDVIDGQQRLTTIILSLCAFRDLFKSLDLDQKGKKYLQTIEELLSTFDINTDETLLRLELQYEESKDYLGKLITQQTFEDKYTPSIKKMEEGYQKIKNQLENYLLESVESLIQFAKYFLTQIDIVVIESENLSSALKIFETINQRGAGLNAMDLVKNLLFSEAKESDFGKIKETWKEINNNLQRCGENQRPLRFLRYFLMARYYEGLLKEDDLYKWIISEAGKASIQYEQNPLAFAKELKKLSHRYANLVLATEWKDKTSYPSVTRIGCINKVKSRQHLILLLSLDVNISDDAIIYLGEQIESFFFFTTTLGILTKSYESAMTKWAVLFRKAKSISAISDIVSHTLESYIKERVTKFKDTFQNLNHFQYNPQYRQRYIMSRIEDTIREKVGLPLKGDFWWWSMQMEHILPQTPKNDALPNTYTDLDDYKAAVYKLGNVTLIESTINQAVNNYNDLLGNWFKQKQKEYTKSDIISTNLLDNEYQIGKNTSVNRFKIEYSHTFESWGKEEIKERQKILLNLAFETWTINGERVDQ